MVALKLALKNIYRNLRYTIGLFVLFFIAAAMCVSFFIFSEMSQTAYGGILARQASSSYVSLSFTTMTFYDINGNVNYTYKGDISDEELEALKALDGVEDVYHYCTDVASCNISLDGGDSMEVSLWPLLFEGGDIPEQFTEEYNALYGDDLLVCGEWINGMANGCLVSEAFVDLIGAEDASDLVGKTLSTYINSYGIYEDESDNKALEITRTEYLDELVICGVVNEKLSEISFMENYGSNFIFTDINNLVYQSSFPNVYLAYADYGKLDDIMEKVENLGITGASVSSGNDSYAMKKISQMSQFVSAILLLIAAVCLFACIAVITGAALFKFAGNKNFYNAAFATGLSKTKLGMCFLFEFLIVAAAAFIAALPAGLLLVNALSGVLSLYMGVSLAANLSASSVVLAFVPVVAAGAVSAIAVRCRLSFK